MSKAAQLRSRGYWSILVGVIVLISCLVGLLQYVIGGDVSIRPGHDPVSGETAVQMLLVAGLVGFFFTGVGALLVFRGRRALKRSRRGMHA